MGAVKFCNFPLRQDDHANKITKIEDDIVATYTVKVTDANGCEKTSDAITLTQPDAPLAVTGTETNVTCTLEW